MKYDPLHPIASDAWLGLDESERLESVIQYHRKARVKLPNERIHAVLHVVVENQLAMVDPVEAGLALERLMNEGLDRHEAIHAIGTLVSENLFGALKGQGNSKDLNERYSEKLSKLTAEAWRNMAP
jgi:hypothetical protein